MAEPLAIGRLLLWLGWVARWVAEPKLLWLALGVILLALVMAFGGDSSEPRVRLTGLVLQVLGLGTVIWGIRKTGHLFGHPSLIDAITAWLSRFPRYQPRILGAVGTATGVGTASMRMSVRAAVPEGAGLEKRVEVLERNLDYVRTEVGELHNELDMARNELRDAVKKETKERTEADHQLSQRLEAAQTSGLYVAATGTAWLFIGVSMSTASLELAKWFG